jgi:hypothetical protein
MYFMVIFIQKNKDHKLVYFNMFAPSHISQDGQMVV